MRTEQGEGFGKVGGYGCHDCSLPGLEYELLKRKMTYLQMHAFPKKKGKEEPLKAHVFSQEAGSRACALWSGVSEQGAVSCESVTPCITHLLGSNDSKEPRTPEKGSPVPLAPVTLHSVDMLYSCLCFQPLRDARSFLRAGDV